MMLFTPAVYAGEKIAASSATITVNRNNKKLMIKKLVIKRILAKHKSPLLAEAATFIDQAQVNELDPYLVVSIAGVESTFGKFLAHGTNNPFGWGGGLIRFSSYKDAISTVSGSLKTKYIDRGANTVAKIGKIYAPPSRTWSFNVENFMKQFYNEEAKIAVLRPDL